MCSSLDCIKIVVAMNPCPCGYWPGKKCRCTDYEVIKYRSRISGPIMDRIDIQKQVHPVNYFESDHGKKTRTSTELRRKVELAREIQQKRYQGEESIYCNAQMTTSMLQNYCTLDSESLDLLRTSSERYGYSASTIFHRETD